MRYPFLQVTFVGVEVGVGVDAVSIKVEDVSSRIGVTVSDSVFGVGAVGTDSMIVFQRN